MSRSGVLGVLCAVAAATMSAPSVASAQAEDRRSVEPEFAAQPQDERVPDPRAQGLRKKGVVALLVGFPLTLGGGGLLAAGFLMKPADRSYSARGAVIGVGAVGALAGVIAVAVGAASLAESRHCGPAAASGERPGHKPPPLRLVSLDVGPARHGAALGATFAF